MPIGIYPPILQSSQPAFLYTTTTYNIQFNLQKITKFSEIGHIQIRLVKQSNNRTIVNTSKYPDGIIYKNASQILKLDNSMYSVSILNSELAETWQPGYLYKVQLRFGKTPIFENINNFATWKKQQIDNQTFSEWSTVMIIKSISKPNVYIENNETVASNDIISTQRAEFSFTPLFIGIYDIDAVNKEVLDQYKFDLYQGKKTLKDIEDSPMGDFIETSGWRQHNTNKGVSDQYRFSYMLTNETIYTVIYSIKTVNGYKETSRPYTFVATKTYLAELKNVKLTIEDNTPYCGDNGCINIYLDTTNSERLSGSYVITRTSEKSNYEVWEDLKYLVYSAKTFSHTLIYQDFTVESGIKYKYAFQQENSNQLRTLPLYEENNRPHKVDFEYSYLYRDGIQLRLMLNQKISSFKHTVLVNKQDTLGSRYPHLTKNGYAYYAEFPISGTISFQMDNDRTFVTQSSKGINYKEELAIPADKFENLFNFRPGTLSSKEDGQLLINSNLTHDNIFIERKFREIAESFLNDFNYKLYKSPTEGNIVIVLNNVSLTPNQTLGRMIFDFSATAYEVLENTLLNLNEYGIIEIGHFQTLASDQIIESFGQVRGIYTKDNSAVDIYNLIKEQEEISIGGGYKLSIQRVSSFWIERYPRQSSILNKEYENGVVVSESIKNVASCKADLIRLEALLADAKNNNNDELVKEIQEEIDKLTELQYHISNSQLDGTIIISVNGKNIMIAPYRLYSLDYPISSLELIASEYPIIVNYMCELNQAEDEQATVVSSIDSSRIWGQVSGIFTDTGDLIKNGYKYKYGQVNIPPYRVFNNQNGNIIYDSQNNILVDDTNYNLYKTLDIFAIIQEDVKRQIQLLYNITDFHQREDGIWVSDTIEYEFIGLTTFIIESDPGTTLLISKNADGTKATEVKIGETGRYSLNNMDGLVKYIRLKSPTFAIVDYKCSTTQMRVR